MSVAVPAAVSRTKEKIEQVVPAGEVEDDDLGAGLDQSRALGGVQVVAADLVGGDANGQPVALAGLPKLDRSLAEDGQLGALEVVLGHDPVDDHLLGVLRDVSQCAVDTAFGESYGKGVGNR
jgi:hypothetical protein